MKKLLILILILLPMQLFAQFGTTIKYRRIYIDTLKEKNSGIGIHVKNNVLFYSSANYLNFSSTQGSSGYGIWNDSGTMKFKNSGGSWQAFSTPDTSQGWTRSAASGLVYATNTSDEIVVGGTSLDDASSKMEIQTTGSTQFQIMTSNTGSWPRVKIKNESGGVGGTWALKVQGTTGHLIFSDESSGSTSNTILFEKGIPVNCFRLKTTTGYAGFGTDSPETQIHVVGNITVDNSIIADDADGLGLYADDGSSGILIQDDGDVGVGTTPDTDSDFHLYRPTTSAQLLVESGQSSNWPRIVVKNSVGEWAWKITGSNGGVAFADVINNISVFTLEQGAGVNSLYISSSGMSSFGGDNPQEQIHSYGKVRADSGFVSEMAQMQDNSGNEIANFEETIISLASVCSYSHDTGSSYTDSVDIYEGYDWTNDIQYIEFRSETGTINKQSYCAIYQLQEGYRDSMSVQFMTDNADADTQIRVRIIQNGAEDYTGSYSNQQSSFGLYKLDIPIAVNFDSTFTIVVESETKGSAKSVFLGQLKLW